MTHTRRLITGLLLLWFLTGCGTSPPINYYVLSAYPYSQCFFCGNAGPETVVELSFVGKQRRLQMDQLVTIKGKLKLNDSNIYQCNYIFEKPVLYKSH